jgi:hypothetical protein
LRDSFPSGRFLSGGSERDDFQTIRRAQHIAVSIGTYSWVAAYLSSAQTIHVPLSGIYDLSLRPEYDLLPTWDPRFVFYKIPQGVWAGRYSDFESRDVVYSRVSRGYVRLKKMVANTRLLVVRFRVRVGIERRMMGDFLHSRGAVWTAKIVGRT